MPGPDFPALITAEAQRQGVDPSVMLNIARQESSLDPSRNSPLGPSYGRGLMGLSDAAAADMGVDPTDLAGNIRGGVGYYKRQLDRFGDPMLAAAAYNAGPEKIARAGNQIPADPSWDSVRKYAMGATGSPSDGSDIFADAPAAGPGAGDRGDGADIFADAPGGGQDPTAAAPKSKTYPEMKAIGDLTPAQREAFFTQYRGGLYDDSKPYGHERNPYFLQPGADPSQLEPGAYYYPTDPEPGQKTAKLARMPGGQGDQHPFMSGLQAGAGDVVNSVAGLMPGHDDSDLYWSNKAQQMAYEAAHPGDRLAQTGRLFGQIGASAPLLAGGEGLVMKGADAAPGALRYLLGDEGALGAAADRIPQIMAPLKRFAMGEAGDLVPGLMGTATRAASRFARGAVEGAGGAALTSQSDDHSLGEQMAGGALGGGILRAAMPGLGATLARMAQGGAVSEATRNLAQTALQKYGIPLRTTQILGVGSRDAAYKDSEMLGQHLTGYAENNEQQRAAFTRALSRTFGADSEQLTPDVMNAARKNLGDQFEAYAASHPITAVPKLQTDLGAVLNDAHMVLSDHDYGPIQRQVNNVLSAIRGGQLSGESYHALIRKGSVLDQAIQRQDAVGDYAAKIRSALDNAAEASSSPQDVAAFRGLRAQYKNLMTVAKLTPKADVEGHISPQLLRGALINNFKSMPFQGAGDLGELAQIAQTFMKEPPNSGSPARIGHMLKSFGGHGAVGAIPAAIFALQHEPAAAMGGAAAGALSLAHKLASETTAGIVGRSERGAAALAGLPPASPTLSSLLSLLANHAGHAQVQTGAQLGRGLVTPALPNPGPPAYAVPQVQR